MAKKKTSAQALTNFRRVAPILMHDVLTAFPRLGVLDAAAIAGNGGAESEGLQIVNERRPVVKGSRGGFHYFQWTGARRRALEAFCKAQRLDINTYAAGLAFLIHELKTTETKAIDALLAGSTLDAKTIAFEQAFERAGVKAYAERKRWALRALHAYEAKYGKTRQEIGQGAKPGPSPAPVVKPAPTTMTTATPPPVSNNWLIRLMAMLGLVKATEAVPVTEFKGYSELVERVQLALQQLGYAEIGMADGFFGGKTEAMIRAFQADNGLAVDGKITDAFLAALPKANQRPVAKERATATARDLRAAGNEPARAFQGLGVLGNLLGLGGVLGGLNETGVFDSVKDAADTATGVLGSVQGSIVAIITVVQWVTAHWWLFAIVAGLWLVFRVAKGVLELVVLFRQGVLQRPSVAPDRGWRGDHRSQD